jgi:hypothetical protein
MTSKWTMIKQHNTLDVIKYNGNTVGELQWKYRPKNAGGAAWQGKILPGISQRHSGMAVMFYSSDKTKVLSWFKSMEDCVA